MNHDKKICRPEIEEPDADATTAARNEKEEHNHGKGLAVIHAMELFSKLSKEHQLEVIRLLRDLL